MKIANYDYGKCLQYDFSNERSLRYFGTDIRIRWSKADRLAFAPSPMAMMICL